LFLANEAALWQLAGTEQINHRADASRGRDLIGAQPHPAPWWAYFCANTRESTATLARKLGVARTTVVARLARLESSGQIVGYTARLGGDAAGRSVQAFVGVTVSPKSGRDVVKRLSELPELRQLASVSGEFDYMALLRADTTARLDALLDEIREIEGVLRTNSSVVLALRVDRQT
jgi:DNA-binding Lrp family transcriptional regulator